MNWMPVLESKDWPCFFRQRKLSTVDTFCSYNRDNRDNRAFIMEYLGQKKCWGEQKRMMNLNFQLERFIMLKDNGLKYMIKPVCSNSKKLNFNPINRNRN